MSNTTRPPAVSYPLTCPDDAGGGGLCEECAAEPEEAGADGEELGEGGVPRFAGDFDARDGDGLRVGFGARLVALASARASCVEPAAVIGRARGGS
jgi:hypothetical protein